MVIYLSCVLYFLQFGNYLSESISIPLGLVIINYSHGPKVRDRVYWRDIVKKMEEEM